MLTVVKRGQYALELSGHAGAGQRGRDLICAGASVLALTLEQSLLDAAAGGEAEILALTLEPGRALFHARPKKGKEERLAALFAAITTGLELLCQYAPEHITLRREPPEGDIVV